MSKTVLFVGGSHADIPQINEVKKKGYKVITTGNNKHDKGHKFADRTILADYSDYDQILNLAEDLEVNAVCASANDFSQLTSSYVAEKLQLPGFDSLIVNEIIHHKDKFKKFCLQNNFPIAKSYYESQIEKLVQSEFPIITKPTDLTGGKGILVSNNINELKDSLEISRKMGKNKNIIIEQYLNGSNHAMCSIIKNGKVIFYFFDNEHYYMNKFLVSGASSSSIVPIEVQKKIIDEINRMCGILSLVDGIIHLQFILQKNNFFFLEICRRPPGDLYTRFVQLSTGKNLPLMIVNSYLGEKNNFSHEIKIEDNFILRHCLMANQSGKIKKILYDDKIKKNIIEEIKFKVENDVIENHLIEKASILFLKFENKNEMSDKLSIIYELIKIEF
tara:strand:- start:42 stop:1208 length:1167 start_codon:yes stop_codon:yes gene_type:complete